MTHSTLTIREEGRKEAQVHGRTSSASIVGRRAIFRPIAGQRAAERKGPRRRETDKGKAKDAAAVAKPKGDEGDEDAAWFAMTAFDSERGDFNRAHAGVTSLSDDFSDLMSDDSDRGRETPGMDEMSEDKSGCESEGESDDGSVDEGDMSMPRLIDPSDSEDSKGNENEATSIFAPGNDAYTTIFASVTSSTILSTLDAVTSYSRPDYFHSAFEELIKNMNDLNGIEHEPGQADAGADKPSSTSRATRGPICIIWKSKRTQSTGVRLESTPFGYPVVNKSWADGLSPSDVALEVDPEPACGT